MPAQSPVASRPAPSKFPILWAALLALMSAAAPASAQVTEASMVGRWSLGTDDLGTSSDEDWLAKMEHYFAADKAWESRVWIRERTAGDTGFTYVGVRVTGTWFLSGTRVGVVTRACEGFTGAGAGECAAEADEINDTDYAAVESIGPFRTLSFEDQTVIPAIPYRGKELRFDPPSFWPASLALRPAARAALVPAEATAAYDALGRRPAPRDGRGVAPMIRFRQAGPTR